jgi:hypothetical protein
MSIKNAIQNSIIPAIQNAIIKKTDSLRNLANSGVVYANWLVTAPGSADVNGIHMVGDGTSKNAVLATSLKVSTDYTVVFKITKWTNPGGNLIIINGDSAFTASTVVATAGTTGLVKKKLTSVSTMVSNRLGLRLAALPIGTDVDFTDVCIFEGDQTGNTDADTYIPYAG